MADIANYEVYTNRMQKSMYDKMFFVDKIFDFNIDTVIDFGCADGELISHLKAFMPEVRFIGYDIDETMIEKAKAKVPFAEFYSNWDDIEFNPETTLLNLSSVMHEVLFYSCPKELKLFWDNILTSNFACITFRDMCKTEYTNALDMEWIEKIKSTNHKGKFKEFILHWGVPKCESDIIHFLLKYRYTENWERELNEDYLSVEKESLIEKFKEYDIVWKEYKSLPFIVSQVKKDFDINVENVPTHLYLILKHK